MKAPKTLLWILAFTLTLIAQAQAQSFLTNGLVAYFPLNGNANDASGNGHDGVVNSATMSTDRFGRPAFCYSFDGVGDSIDFGTNLNIGSPFSSWTITVWFLALGDGPIFTDYEGTDTGGDNIFVGDIALDSNPVNSPATNHLAVGSRNYPTLPLDHSLYYSQQSFTDNHWHSVVYAVDGSGSCYVSVDGQPVATLNYLPGLNYIENPHWRAGGGLLFAGQRQYFKGLIDDIRIYNRALSTNEVAQLYALESAPILNVRKALYLNSSNLWVGTNYQVQISTNLNSWTDYGTPFMATDSSWHSTNYWDVNDWNQLFFRLQVAP